ncbi:hypothetical protein LTR37_021203 [Vermiconidia calcicola]|uniref:Uncharacterized protein n=1 Tax=Vermiconidia calcicola TaxID=1690605 RepID=A0ACC3M9H0_9PEZI|nr:hypothetical protein LTR37_021203 [Vermiconidia calcicola]
MCGTLYTTDTAAAVNNFFPIVVSGLGFGTNKTYGLTAPPFLLCVLCMLANGFHSDKKQEGFLHIALPLTVTVLANIIAVATLNVGARLWTAYTYYDEPRYVAAFAVNFGAAVIAIGMATTTFLYLRRQNAKLDRGGSLGKSGPTAIQQASGFRYIL